MARAIWKFPFDIKDHVRLDMPEGAKPLSAQTQNGSTYLWAEVDPGATVVPRSFFIYGTGHPMPDNPGQHISTFQVHGGHLIFHMYETSR